MKILGRISGLVILFPSISSYALDAEKREFLLKLFEWPKLLGTLAALLTIVLGAKIIRGGSDILARAWPKKRLLIFQIRLLLVFAVYGLGAVAIVGGVWGLTREGMIVFGATVLLALGFAFKDLARSLIGGLILLFDPPFQVGDRVSFRDLYGDVKSIGLRATRILTLDESLVTVPNHLFLNEAVLSANAGELGMLVTVDFYVALDSDAKRAQELAEQAVTETSYLELKKPFTVLIKEVPLGPNVAYRLRVKAHIQDFRKEKAFETDLTLKIHALFQKHAIARPIIFQ